MQGWRRRGSLLLATYLLGACVKSPTEPVEHEVDASAATDSDSSPGEAGMADARTADAQSPMDAGPMCSSSADCAGQPDGRLHCATYGDCVVCEINVQCTQTSAPRCAAEQCGACTLDADCARFSDTPLCGPAGSCVACRADAPALCTAQSLVCQQGANSCVACNTNAECKDPTKPICDGNACRACSADADCAGSGQVCQASTGKCVDCKPNAQDPTLENCANGNACDPTALTCTGLPRLSLEMCGERAGVPYMALPCVSDSECKQGLRCVATEFPSGMPYKAYCLQPQNEGRCPEQYPIARSLKSSLGIMNIYCLPNDAYTTCDGIRGFRRSGCKQDDDCGASGLADGLCLKNNAAPEGQCSYGCDSPLDCSGGKCGGNKYCRLD